MAQDNPEKIFVLDIVVGMALVSREVTGDLFIISKSGGYYTICEFETFSGSRYYYNERYYPIQHIILRETKENPNYKPKRNNGY